MNIIPKHVPGRLNCHVDSLSRPGEEQTAWQGALAKIAEAWGPLQEDPCGFTGDPTSILETLEWRSKRTLLFPRVSDIQETITLLERVVGIPPENPPSAWLEMAVLITPLWRGSAWWPRLVKIRYKWLALGRLPHRWMKGWAARNSHWTEWTASLIALGKGSGHQER